jgi:hypothetical protein
MVDRIIIGASACLIRVTRRSVQTRLYGSCVTVWELVPDVNCSNVWLLITSYISASGMR